MRQLHINTNDAEQRVDKFLSKSLPNLPKSLMYKYIRNKKIKVNGSRCSVNQQLNVGDVLTCYIAEEFFEVEKDKSFLGANKHLDVIYEDQNIIIMNKEVGLLAHGEHVDDVDTLVNRMKFYLYQKGEYDVEGEKSFAPALAHRLDRNTQGLVIGAKNAESLRIVNQLIKDHNVHKQYLAIVEGMLDKQKGSLIHYHKKENQKIYISDFNEDGYKQIQTDYKVVGAKDTYSLLDIRLHTGKSHQIRAQFAHVGHPLLGDMKYGAKKSSFQYQALCAYALTFDNVDGTILSNLNNKKFELREIAIVEYFNSIRKE